MKNTVFISAFAFFVGLHFASFSQNVALAKKETNLNSNLAWNANAHDFGKIKKGVPASTTFEFTNESAEEIVISSVKGSCGCTATNYTKTPIGVGKKGQVVATYNAANTGVFNKTITVNLKNSASPIVLSIKGEVAE